MGAWLRAPQGHSDWVFGITWVTEAHVVTVSRDQHVKLWHVDGGSGSAKPNSMPLQSQLPFKVRRDSGRGPSSVRHRSPCRPLCLPSRQTVLGCRWLCCGEAPAQDDAAMTRQCRHGCLPLAQLCGCQ